MRPSYFRLTKVEAEPEDGMARIITNALIFCQLCNATIASHGGPDHGAVCTPCGKLLKSGSLRGLVRHKPEADGDDQPA